MISPIRVTELGVFEAQGDGTIAGTIQVAIFESGNPIPVTPVVSFHGTYAPVGFFVFQSITPVVLLPGTYQVDAVGFGNGDANGNRNTGSTGPDLDTGGGLIAFTGAAYNANTALVSPTTCVGCQTFPAQASQFDAGSFVFGSAPEPATFGLIGAALTGLAALAGRRKRRAN